MCPGKPEWVLGVPLFDQAEIRLQDGREIRIETHGRSRGSFESSYAERCGAAWAFRAAFGAGEGCAVVFTAT